MLQNHIMTIKNIYQMSKQIFDFVLAICLQKNQINRNKTDNKAKADNKNIDFMPFIQNNINGHIEWE